MPTNSRSPAREKHKPEMSCPSSQPASSSVRPPPAGAGSRGRRQQCASTSRQQQGQAAGSAAACARWRRPGAGAGWGWGQGRHRYGSLQHLPTAGPYVQLLTAKTAPLQHTAAPHRPVPHLRLGAARGSTRACPPGAPRPRAQQTQAGRPRLQGRAAINTPEGGITSRRWACSGVPTFACMCVGVGVGGRERGLAGRSARQGRPAWLDRCPAAAKQQLRCGAPAAPPACYTTEPRQPGCRPGQARQTSFNPPFRTPASPHPPCNPPDPPPGLNLTFRAAVSSLYCWMAALQRMSYTATVPSWCAAAT